MTPKLYSFLAQWWPLLSAPADYEEESSIYGSHLIANWTGDSRPTLLELGCGGGSNASFLKRHFEMTLTDISDGMLAHSRELNAECEHLRGDMRTLRLGRNFDRVFIHDAICYMASIADLRKAVETAYLHCRPGGVALFAPDCVRETFYCGTEHGGNDGADRSLRYLEWTWDPDPLDSQYTVDYVYVLRDATGSITVEHDRHIEGLFAREEWLQVLRDVGFEPRVEPFNHSQVEEQLDLFVGVKPA